MKRILLACAVMGYSLTGSAQIHGVLSFDGGNVVIKEGSHISEVTRYLGRADYISQETVCTRIAYRECHAWSNVERHYYRHRNQDWEIDVLRGRVIKVHWSGYP